MIIDNIIYNRQVLCLSSSLRWFLTVGLDDFSLQIAAVLGVNVAKWDKCQISLLFACFVSSLTSRKPKRHAPYPLRVFLHYQLGERVVHHPDPLLPPVSSPSTSFHHAVLQSSTPGRPQRICPISHIGTRRSLYGGQTALAITYATTTTQDGQCAVVLGLSVDSSLSLWDLH